MLAFPLQYLLPEGAPTLRYPVMLARYLNTAWPLSRSQRFVLTVTAKNSIFNLCEPNTKSRRSCYGIVSIVTRPRAGPSVVQFLVETKRHLSPQNVRTGSEDRPASFPTAIISNG